MHGINRNADRVQYTYWDYFRNAFAHNWGWRIDHILATAPAAAVCRSSDVDLETRRAAGASDHALVWADFDYDAIRVECSTQVHSGFQP